MWLIGITLFMGALAGYILYRAVQDGRDPEPPEGTVITYPDEGMFMENDYIDEYSPEQLELDETLKVLNLRKKLEQIEKERNENT
jgi:hypothetical protein